MYKQKIVPSLIEEFGYKNIEQVPKIVKISVNRGVGEASKNSKELEFLQGNVNELCTQLNKLAINDNKMYRSIGIQFVNEDLSTKTKSRMLKNPVNSEEELKKVANQLLEEALTEQVMLVRRIGVRISEFSDVEGQSSITNYF